MRRTFAAALVVLAACPKPTDGTPEIKVSPGAAARMNMIPSRAAKAQPSATARARVHRMTDAERLGGPNATGRAGDWMLDNDEVVFVIDALGGGGGFAQSGGNLLDAADARVRKDELGQIFSYFGTFPRQGVYTRIEPHEAEDGTAILEARGHELYEPSIEVVTEYRLAGSDRALLIRTTLANTGATSTSTLSLGDAIQWGGTEKFAPGKAVGFTGKSQTPFLGGIGRFTSYAITSTDGEIGAISGGAWSDTEQKKNVTLGPRQSVTYERVLVVGERPDAASVVAELTRASGGDVGAIAISLVDAAGKPVRAPIGAKVLLSDALSIVATKEGDTFGGDVPPGNWIATYAPSAGRRGDGAKVAATVKKGEVTRVTLAVSDVGALTAGCEGKDKTRVPCKITVEGLDGAPQPDFGPAHVAAAAKNQLFAVSADAAVAIAPGKYRLTATRGPEYEPRVVEVTVGAGGEARTTMELERVVDTSGWVATDFHQHSILSADAPVATHDRVRSSVVECVEVPVATEHNNVADLRPIAKELGLESFVAPLPGDEITSDPNKHPWGHANVFPLVPEPGKSRGGAFEVTGRTPREVFAEARARPGPHVLQVNHPRSGLNGYFDQMGFDPKTGVGTDPGYDAVFDAIEVWNGRSVEHRAKVLEDYFALLRTNHPVTPIADTDTHGIVGQEAGFPRTYVKVASDVKLEAWSDDRTADLVRGVRERREVVLTNGPFLRVTANGASIGGIAKGQVVTVKIVVQSASFAAPDTIALRAAGDAKITPEKVALVPKKNASGAMEAEAVFTVRASRDDAFVAIASGGKPMKPMFAGDDKELSPWAMSGPIWIDADADGKSLGR